jgi:hypothetical protein
MGLFSCSVITKIPRVFRLCIFPISLVAAEKRLILPCNYQNTKKFFVWVFSHFSFPKAGYINAIDVGELSSVTTKLQNDEQTNLRLH